MENKNTNEEINSKENFEQNKVDESSIISNEKNMDNNTNENVQNSNELGKNIEEKDLSNNINNKTTDSLNNEQPQEGNSKKIKKKKSIFRKLLNISCKIIGYILITLTIIILVRALVFKRYDVFGYRFYLIMSGSMEPTIHISDAVITKEVDELKENDVIAYQHAGSTTIHRIVKVYTENNEKKYQTKGDNNNTIDKGLVSNDEVRGKVVLRIPKAGDAVLFLQRNIVIIAILIVGVILIITIIRRLL